MRNDPPGLGDLPVTIISGGRPGAAHAASAAALANGRLVVAAGAGHNVLFDRPDVVIEEILRTPDR